ESGRPNARRNARLAAGDIRFEGGDRGRPEEHTGDARGRRRPRGVVDDPARGSDSRSPIERAPIRFAARHHEGTQEGTEGDPAWRPRRRHRAAAQGAEDGASAEATGRPQGRDRRGARARAPLRSQGDLRRESRWATFWFSLSTSKKNSRRPR